VGGQRATYVVTTSLRRRARTALDIGDAVGAVGHLADFLGGVAAVVFVLLFVAATVWLSPLTVCVVVLVVAAAGVWSLGVLLRRPWVVLHASADGSVVQKWRVVGWREAHRVMVEASEQLQTVGDASPVRGWA